MKTLSRFIALDNNHLSISVGYADMSLPVDKIHGLILLI